MSVLNYFAMVFFAAMLGLVVLMIVYDWPRWIGLVFVVVVLGSAAAGRYIAERTDECRLQPERKTPLTLFGLYEPRLEAIDLGLLLRYHPARARQHEVENHVGAHGFFSASSASTTGRGGSRYTLRCKLT
jgi:hypothetical protein